MKKSSSVFSVVRRPSRTLDVAIEDASSALEYEIAREKASNLGRLGRRLEASLAALEAFDATHRRGEGRGERDMLVNEAGNVLWHFVVQREACGLRDSARVMQHYRVPNEVQGRMGIARRAARDDG
jgi:hypothetical protein